MGQDEGMIQVVREDTRDRSHLDNFDDKWYSYQQLYDMVEKLITELHLRDKESRVWNCHKIQLPNRKTVSRVFRNYEGLFKSFRTESITK
jgi:hypothetical protein